MDMPFEELLAFREEARRVWQVRKGSGCAWAQ